jgi:carbamoyl-phosphate synthase large subunit
MSADRAMTVLVLGVGGQVSQGMVKALRHGALPVRVVGACVSPLSTGLYVCDAAYVSPFADDPDFAEWLAGICERERVAAVLSGAEPVLDALAPNAAALHERTGAVSVVSSPDVLAVGRDKLATARWLEDRGLPFARSADAADDAAVDALVERCGFPLIAKPRAGKGSQGVAVLAGGEGLARVRGTAGVVVQELLGDADTEFTAGCFVDRDGVLRGSIVMRRSLHAGTTVSAEVGAHDAVREVAESVCSALRPLGPCNVQLRVHEGVPTPFEINVRFSGTTPMRTRFGFDEVGAALRHLVLGEPADDLPRVERGVALRYWNEMYVDEADVAALRRTGSLTRDGGPRATMEDWGL